MPWKAKDLMDLRLEFVRACKQPGAQMSEVCRQYGVSRKTGYKWLKKHATGGAAALSDAQRRPNRLQNIDAEIALRIVELREQHPRWGAKKIVALLKREGTTSLPSTRTVTRVLERRNLLRKRTRRRPRSVSEIAPNPIATAPNQVWTVDFKGWWRTQDGQRSEPLTVRDAYSRFVLSIRLLPRSNHHYTKLEFERLFRECGLPEAILIDNGSPFACTRSPMGLSKLSAWWVSLGIRVLRSRPAHPEDNGAHERMHADMASELQCHPAGTLAMQQHECSRWRAEYNEVRPHEALGMQTPAELYRPSERAYRGPRLPMFAQGTITRVVGPRGIVRYRGHVFYLSRSVSGYTVGLTWSGPTQCHIYFYELNLGEFELPFDDSSETHSPHPLLLPASTEVTL